MQVQVAHIAAELARRRDAHQRVHVGAVHVHPPAVLVHERAQLLDLRLEHAVRARVGDHHAGEVGAVLLALGLQVGQVDVAVLVAARHDHLHAGHLRARGVGAVGGGGDQADVAVALALAFVEGLDREQARVFALRAGVGLQADARVAGGLAQPGAQLLVEFRVALQLVGRRERMDVREFRPGDRDHLARGIELHRAAAQRDHAAVQREVLVGQRADVAQHAGLGVVGVEHRVREEVAGAAQLLRDQRLHAFLERGERRQRPGPRARRSSTAARCRRAWSSRRARCTGTRPSKRAGWLASSGRGRPAPGCERRSSGSGCRRRRPGAARSRAAPGPWRGWPCSWPRAARCA